MSAFKLAEKGLGYTSPNPPVGALLVKDGRIIARGFHRRAGGLHAEIEAIRKAGDDARGASLVVTLEPCSHHGKTPPCSDAIIAAGISKVVCPVIDKNPIVSGRGFRKLHQAGVEVIQNIGENYAETFYRPYFKFVTEGLPFVTLKFAQSLDGRIASSTGHSRWISSAESLKRSHKLRASHDAILVGAETLRNDNPQLTTRLVKGSNPIRIVLSNSGQIGRDRIMFKDGLARSFVALPENTKTVPGTGFDIIPVKTKRGVLDLRDLLSRLGKMGIMTLMVEGGSLTLTSFLTQKLVDKIIVCVAPIIIGDGIPAIRELGIKTIGKSIGIDHIRWQKSGPDMIMSGNPVWR